LIDYYRRAQLLITVPGAGPIDAVKQATLEAAQSLLPPTQGGDHGDG
jgi:hypothetical protein